MIAFVWSFQKHDFNHDGRPDLLLSTTDGPVLLYGTGNALIPFRPGWVRPLSGGSYYAVIADFDGDGIDDIASINNTFTDTLTVFRGNASGGFTRSYSTDIYNCPKLAVGDFNGDGKLDIATSYVQILTGKGDGTFWPPQILSDNTFPSLFVLAEDINGNGRTDLVFNRFHSTIHAITVLLTNPAGSGFLPPKYIQLMNNDDGEDVRYADLDGDGIKDLLITTDNVEVIVLRGLPEAEFEQAYYKKDTDLPFMGEPRTIQTGDFNGDGKLDFALPGPDSYSISVYLGNGDATFRYDSNWDAGITPNWAAAGQFTSNSRPGRDDLVVSNGDGTLSLLLNLTP